jgi:sugar lactone lactonase YvrE
VYVADAGNNVIRKITQAGVVTTFAGTGTAGSTNSTNPLTATFKNPHGIVVDALNNVYVADTSNNLIRKIASTGPVTTFAGSLTTTFLNDGVGAAASFNLPNGIIMDKTGTTLYVTDTYNHAIRGIVISSALVYTVAGSGPFSGGTLDGPTTAATLSFPANVAVDASNNIYVADNQGMLIRKIVGSYSGGAYSGTVTKLAGASVNGFGDGPALASAFYGLAGVAVDSSNNVFVTDSGNNLIRKYTP